MDLKEIILFFWDKRFTILKFAVAFFVLGLLIVWLSRVEYQAETTLLPESQSSQNVGSNLLRQYGGMLGIEGRGNNSGNVISPSLYPDIIASAPYQVELMNVPVYFSSLDTTLTPHQYFQSENYPLSAGDYIVNYTIGLPWQIPKMFQSNKKKKMSQEDIISKINPDSVISLSSPQRSTIGTLSNRLVIDQSDGIITLSVKLPDPRASAEVGQAAITLLKEYVKEYRTQKANEELQFVENQVEEAEKRFEKAQQQLADFQDSNVNIATAKAQTKEQELQSQYDLTFDIYNSLRQQLEQAKLKVQEDTPVFTTVEPFQVPTSNSEPKTELLIMAFTFLGVVIASVYIVGKRQWKNFQLYISDRS